ncbi:MAG: Heavy-metal resistance protein CzcE [Betaproteobacteria bacterium]|nr:Heavy-metal resistance protein CzcE [Betaproteobacteria bacterium]
MKSIIRIGTAAAALAVAMTLAPAAYSADETVKITPATHSVGVYRGDTVKFTDVQTGQSFNARFDSATPTDLNQIAPAGALGDQHVTVYVWDQVGEANG